LSCPDPPFSLSRRRFVEGVTTAGFAASFGLPFAKALAATGPATLTGDKFDLSIGTMPFNVTGRARTATAVNNSVPAPILRFREGDTVTLNVTNRLNEPTSIHWHGILLPNNMDGVPGLTFKGIMPGETFTYRFPIIQSGTYWYHSHSGMQEQTGLYGPLILEPKEKDPFAYDRDYVVMLSDWTDEDPMQIVSNLKQQSDYYNYGRRTLGTFIADVKRDGLGATIKERLMWGDMNMTPTDIMDVTGATYTFLINGQPPAASWTGLFSRGERLRLRFINGSSMSTFDVRIPGLKMTVMQADGTNVSPVDVEEFRIGVAETFDVLVTPSQDAHVIFAQAQDRSGYAKANLATREGMTVSVPPMDPRPMRTMADMGMDMSSMDMGGMDMSGDKAMPGMDMSGGQSMQMNMDDKPMPGMDMPGSSTMQMNMDDKSMPGMHMDHGSMPGMAMDHKMPPAVPSTNADGVDPMTLKGKPSVDNVAMKTAERQSEAGDGLDGNGRQVLTYSQLSALKKSELGPPTRELQFHLTGNMERWTWGFDGKRFSEAEPIHVKLGERVRFLLINDTMMEHPIHLHGFLFEVENGQDNMPMKHTVNVKPGEKVGVIFTADVPGYWAFHCHLLYHMEMGMFRTVVVA
jgi:CopA family copper-resistance protein